MALGCITSQSCRDLGKGKKGDATRLSAYSKETDGVCAAPFGISIFTYVFGLVFYALHFPECAWPGRFDYWGHSHQVSLGVYATIQISDLATHPFDSG